MTHKLHSGEARRYVRMAQLAGVALGVSAAALWALDVPGLVYREPPRPQIPAQPAIQPVDNQAPRFERDRMEDLAVRLEQGRKAAPREQKPVEPVKQAQQEPDKPPAGPAISYLGCIYEGSRMLAVLSVDGRQRIVAEGRSFGDARLVSVAEHQVEVQDASGRRAIPRAERTSSAVSWLSNMPSAAPVVANIPGQNNTRAGRQVPRAAGLSPEMEQRFRERGMDPNQVQRWREAVRQREAQRASGQVPPVTIPSDASTGGIRDADAGAVRTITREGIDGDVTETEIIHDEDGNVYQLKLEREGGELPPEDERPRP